MPNKQHHSTPADSVLSILPTRDSKPVKEESPIMSSKTHKARFSFSAQSTSKLPMMKWTGIWWSMVTVSETLPSLSKTQKLFMISPSRVVQSQSEPQPNSRTRTELSLFPQSEHTAKLLTHSLNVKITKASSCQAFLHTTWRRSSMKS